MKTRKQDPRRGRPPQKSAAEGTGTGVAVRRRGLSTTGWAWAVGGVALATLAWSLRGYTPGVPVADDYAFLFHLAFQHPLDWLDSMGATYYWRPFSRQAWFSLIGPTLITAPLVAAFANALVLAGTSFLMFRIARRGLPPLPSAAIAVLPILAEPARALVAWPSGSQHLLAGLFVVLTVHEALASRWLFAAAAAGLGLLSHESAALALIALPVIAWRQGRPKPIALLSLAAVVGLWAWGYSSALRHGVALPPRSAGAFSVASITDLFRRAIPAALNFEDLHPQVAAAMATLYVLLAIAAIGICFLAPARQRLAKGWRAPVLLAIAFGLAVLPLAQLLPDWNAWRAWVSALVFGAAAGVLLATIHPALAVAFAGIRLLALLLAHPAPDVVLPHPLPTASHMSYLRLARLQKTVDSARRALVAAHPQLPRGARVRFWNLPRFAEVGFLEDLAPRVWYRDSSLTWRSFGGRAGLFEEFDVLVEFVDLSPDPAAVLEPVTVKTFVAGARAQLEGRYLQADSLYAIAIAVTRSRGPMLGTLYENRATTHLAMGSIDSTAVFIQRSYEIVGESADYWAVEARVRGARGDRQGAVRALERLIQLNPKHADAPEIARLLGLEDLARQLSGTQP